MANNKNFQVKVNKKKQAVYSRAAGKGELGILTLPSVKKPDNRLLTRNY